MNNKLLLKKPQLLYFLFVLVAVAYYLLTYQTARENFYQVIILFCFLFAAYFVLYKLFSLTHFNQLVLAGLGFRLLLLLSVPNLSEDVYRFIWDGRLAAQGINPFSHLPAEIMHMQPVAGITPQLFAKLNSPGYYTIYPPVLQGVFWIGAKLFPLSIIKTIIFFKVIIVIADVGIFFLMKQVLKQLSLPKHLSLMYFLNPLVIEELTGNAHFEGLMIFFALFAFFFLFKMRWMSTAIAIGFGIATKILPILFIPLIFKKLGFKKGVLFAVIAGVVTFFLFLLVFNISTVQHLLNSINLFFRNFEFNASIYYLVRWIGERVTGYNIIARAGPILSLTAALIIFIVSFSNQKYSSQILFRNALFIISTWFLFSTTVHPWYICLPLALSVFTTFRFPIVWSFTALLSYAAYQSIPVHENLWLIGAGYIFMIGYGLWEMWKTPAQKPQTITKN